MGIRTTTFLLCSLLALGRGQVSGWDTTAEVTPFSHDACGGELTDPQGEIKSPNFPGNYPSNAQCQWVIRTSRGRTVQLNFTDFSLEQDVPCRYDSVSVYDGPSASNRMIGKFCGTDARFINSTGTTLTVIFRSDGSSNFLGFRAVYDTLAQGSCRYNCGYSSGSCSCNSNCRFYGNCCHDYYEYCEATTAPPRTTAVAQGSCRYNCGYFLGSCSCNSNCRYYGNCCHDYREYCEATTAPPRTTAVAQRSCRYNCGYSLGSCSCNSNCRYYGNCCHDYYEYCEATTAPPRTTAVARGSCRYNCGSSSGSCACYSSCRYYGNCCHDYYDYCVATTAPPRTTAVARGSCRYNCGYSSGSCSCYSSCRYYGNCCHDYHEYCEATTAPPRTTAAQGSCRYNCGSSSGSCSCYSSCRYYGNCCHDYHDYCVATTASPQLTTAGHSSCGGHLHGSGSFSSPNYPNYYHDNAYCVWQISAPSGQTIFLAITDLELENCCNCDYIAVYDGSSLNSRPMGKVCSNGSLDAFHSSSNYLTVLFRTDSSVVARGFRAEYSSSLSTNSGRVDCSSDNMNIVIQTSYLNPMGYSGYDLYLNDQHCRPQVFSHQVVFSFALNTCGTKREFNNGRVVYSNGVRAYRSNAGEITRQSPFTLHVFCRMEKDTVAQIMYEAKEIAEGTIVGTGRFNATMAFYTSSNFYYLVQESPYRVTLSQYLYVQVQLRRSDSGLVLFLDTCVASPSPHDFSTRSYDLVRNGCRQDSTYYSYASGTRSVAQFRFQAFQFLRSHSTVYLQCKVMICKAHDSSSRCTQGCRSRVARDLGPSSESQSDSATVVLGPIQLRDSKKQEEKPLEQAVVQVETPS